MFIILIKMGHLHYCESVLKEKLGQYEIGGKKLDLFEPKDV